jgi:hypothetical protein
MNLSFPAVQPGTEEPRDLAYLQQLAAPPATAITGVATPSAAAPMPSMDQSTVQQPATPSPVAQQPPLPALERREPSAEGPRAGVNSMFGL